MKYTPKQGFERTAESFAELRGKFSGAAAQPIVSGRRNKDAE